MTNICSGGKPLILGGSDGIVLPLGGDWEAKWPRGLKVFLYMLGLFWCFAGVGIIADRFMGAIERITSVKTRIKRNGKDITVKFWNDTVANLTLMALGSSAPEILLSLIELVLSENWHSGALGPSTIVGSAAFNLLVITAVCVSALPAGETRVIKDLGVFSVTATFSVFAYLWLLVILVGISPDVVEVWEGVVTFLFFPVLVIIAFMADRGYFSRLCTCFGEAPLELTPNTTPEEYDKMLQLLRTKYGRLPEDTHDQHALAYHEFGPGATRAVHRVQATRMLSGSTSVFGTMPRWMRGIAVSKTLKEENKLGNGAPAPDAVVSFMSSHYALSEADKKVSLTVKVVRKGNHNNNIRVCYKTRNGSAEEGKDYKKAAGSLVFGPNDEMKSFDIAILEDKKHEPTEEFYVDLLDARGATLGSAKTATIVVLDADHPGVIAFDQEEIKVPQSTEKIKFPIIVKRRKGASGKVTCKYRTEDHSAKQGHDYTPLEGTLEFGPGATVALLDMEILPKSKHEKTETFRIYLEEPDGGAEFDPGTDGGKDSNICTVLILNNPEGRRSHWDSIMSNFNFDELEIGRTNWRDQFAEAFYCGGSKQAQENSCWAEWPGHIICIFWKLLFAFVPPVDFAGGWLCFFSALLMIGVLTTVIGDLANLLGCALDMKAQICAVTFVALGTSLPDTFASMVAARQDPTADNSIGNVTGSNSVNVFLGLGLPWMMGAIYWKIKGATPEWIQRGNDVGWLIDLPHIQADWPDGAFVVVGGNLGTSVAVFCCCAVACIMVLMLRRKFAGGELGGDKRLCYATSGFLVGLWVVYIIMSIVAEGGLSPY